LHSGLFNSGNAVPLTVVVFFAAPLVVALFAGTRFLRGRLSARRAARPAARQTGQSPAWLGARVGGVIPFLFWARELIFAATGTGFIIAVTIPSCRCSA
jgi:hypothetical protein